MNGIVPSRFSCLRIDDEEPTLRPKNRNKKVSTPSTVTTNKVNEKASTKQSNQSAASKKKKEKKKLVVQTAKQWEQWRDQDDKTVDEVFKDDLAHATLMSLVEFEQNKEQKTKTSDDQSSDKKNDKNSKKKIKTISLNEFLSKNDTQKQEQERPKEEDFFDKFEKNVECEMNKEKLKGKIKFNNEGLQQEIISNGQFYEQLENEKKKNKELQIELEKYKEELLEVKSKNEKLSLLLQTGQMKEMKDVLMDLESMNMIKNDLTEEVSRLHGLLEQERSKVALLLGENRENKNKEKKTGGRKH